MTTRLKGNCYLIVVVVEVEVLCWIDHRSTDRGVSRIPLVKQEATRSKKLEDQESNQESVDPGSDPGTSQEGVKNIPIIDHLHRTQYAMIMSSMIATTTCSCSVSPLRENLLQKFFSQTVRKMTLSEL